MEKNLDITKPPYREHVLPVPWHFVEVPLYILYCDKVDCEQSLFFFRFSKESARAREWRSRETRETRAAARISHARDPLRISRFARRTTEKRETARGLVIKHHGNRVIRPVSLP